MSESDPIDPPEPPAPPDPSTQVPRRAVLDIALTATAGTLGALAFVPALRFATPPQAPEAGAAGVVAGRRDQFQERTARLVMLDEDPIVVVALQGGEIRAFGARCSHLGCIVQYSRTSEQLECPCHGGRFAVDGRPVAGPPPAPLREYTVQIRGGDVVVVRG